MSASRCVRSRRWLRPCSALGGNVGDSRAILDRAVALLCDGEGTPDRSLVGLPNAALGRQISAALHQSCIAVETTLTPHDCWRARKRWNCALGRDRADEKALGPRTADIDILAYDDLVLHEPNLMLPHPRLFERPFVLVPLAEIAGDRMIAGRRVDEAASRAAGIGAATALSSL